MGTGETPSQESPLERDLSHTYEALRDQLGPPMLVTVGAQGGPHCSFVGVSWSEGDKTLFIDPAPRGWNAAEAAGHHQVSLVWPPASSGDYSLIVDGHATAARQGEVAVLALEPTRGVLHRRLPTPAGVRSECGWDCVPVPVEAVREIPQG